MATFRELKAQMAALEAQAAAARAAEFEEVLADIRAKAAAEEACMTACARARYA
ncbi:hypothetical protein VSR34_37000 [Paraburkholderia sp. JHI2823]|uniref:hypothetical protein n=1 Tax=Paraburkholderia sp. JHI2823 TaxID=3112960 RepID=UPI00317F8F01